MEKDLMIKNTWVLPIIEEFEKANQFGKISLNFVTGRNNGVILGVKKEADIQKPKENDKELE